MYTKLRGSIKTPNVHRLCERGRGGARLPHAAGRIWGHPGASSRRSRQNKLVKSVKCKKGINIRMSPNGEWTTCACRANPCHPLEPLHATLGAIPLPPLEPPPHPHAVRRSATSWATCCPDFFLTAHARLAAPAALYCFVASRVEVTLCLLAPACLGAQFGCAGSNVVECGLACAVL